MTVPPGLHALLEPARAERRAILYEHEAYALLEAFGIACPRHRFVPAAGMRTRAGDASGTLEQALAAIEGDRVVVKAVAPHLLHKSDVGGVRILPHEISTVAAAVQQMLHALAAHAPAGVLLVEHVPHDVQPGSELLLGARWTDEFGPVVTVAPGGLHAEFLAAALRDDRAIAVVPAGEAPGAPRAALAGCAWLQLATEPQRGAPPRVSWEAVERVLHGLLRLARAFQALGIGDCEINPAVVAGGRLVPLDALVTLGRGLPETAPRPASKLQHLFAPRRIAVVGVSDGMNPGRLVLRNILREGFPAEGITVIKPGRDRIDGCRCVPDVASLEAPVDLLVVAVGAAHVPGVVEAAVAAQAAESLIVIPGGLEETSTGGTAASRVRAALDAARATPWGGPVVVGGNCLGIRSRPGRYDTMFIPEPKLPAASGADHPVAVIAQSGAFAIARASRWETVTPRYLVTLGNQTDVTVGDVLEWLRDDPQLTVFALYVEGFKPGDGRRTLRAAADITASGRSVVLYRAGRTRAGAQASRSHTASIAGDYRVTRLLFEQAGVLVADTLDAFDDLVALALASADRQAGPRLAALSNAGFECVAMGDALGSLELAAFGDATRSRLASLFADAGLAGIVDVHNPLDLTPMADDGVYEAIVRAALDDEGVDAAVVGVVPLTGALQTLPASPDWVEDLSREEAVAARLARVNREVRKPMLVVVDAGSRFDPLARALAAGGLAVFRSAPRAVRALDTWVRAARGRGEGDTDRR
jgi:acyl-CoA synthetase (NDP forming)